MDFVAVFCRLLFRFTTLFHIYIYFFHFLRFSLVTYSDFVIDFDFDSGKFIQRLAFYSLRKKRAKEKKRKKSEQLFCYALVNKFINIFISCWANEI